MISIKYCLKIIYHIYIYLFIPLYIYIHIKISYFEIISDRNIDIFYRYYQRYFRKISLYILTCIKYKRSRNSHIAVFHFRSINIYVAISNQNVSNSQLRLAQDAMLDQTDNTHIFLCTIEDLLGSVWSFACNGVDVKKLSWICSTGNAYISINFSSSPSTPAAPSPTLKNPSLFPTTVRFLELHRSHTSAICLRVHVQGCIRACTSTRVRHSGPLVIFDSGSQFHVLLAFFFVRRLTHTVISLLSLTSIECLDRFLRHLSFSMGTSQQIFCFFV